MKRWTLKPNIQPRKNLLTGSSGGAVIWNTLYGNERVLSLLTSQRVEAVNKPNCISPRFFPYLSNARASRVHWSSEWFATIGGCKTWIQKQKYGQRRLLVMQRSEFLRWFKPRETPEYFRVMRRLTEAPRKKGLLDKVHQIMSGSTAFTIEWERNVT
jgi:hypothetical protein